MLMSGIADILLDVAVGYAGCIRYLFVFGEVRASAIDRSVEICNDVVSPLVNIRML